MDFERYNSIKEDPKLLLILLNKYVRVEMVKDVTYSGYLLAVDPETYSVVLAVPQDGDIFKKVLVPGHAILNIEENKSPTVIKPLVMTPKTPYFEDVSERKAKLISWLKKNLLPVTDVDENIIIGNAYIIPPYTQLDVCAENPIIVNQVRNMISKMPNDYEQ